MELPDSFNKAAEKMPVTTNGTLLVLGTGFLGVASTMLATENYVLAAGMAVVGVALLFVREKLP